jgi:hypothetical protein
MTSGIPRVSSMTCSEIRTGVGEPPRISAASARAPSSEVQAVAGLGSVDGDFQQVTVAADQDMLVPVA